MTATAIDALEQIQEMEGLRRYVADTLGRFELLDVDQCKLSEQVLYRGKAPCGVHFWLHGPRAVCLSAIWETERNSILFYGSCGRRVHRTKLLQAPSIDALRSLEDGEHCAASIVTVN
jgi:hypothetical protein